ncbi:MAG: hypothetical protein Kow0063_23630 [Anaerolineae bacterium]
MGQAVPQNPYNATTPVVDPNMFFGRQEELVEIIEKRIKHSHPISTILIGGRRIGKTSLLCQIRHRLLKHPNYDGGILVPAYINLQASSGFNMSAVFDQIVSEIRHTLHQHWSLVVDSLDEVADDSYKGFRQRMQGIQDQFGERIGSPRFVILIDEADRLLGYSWTEDIISNLRELINTSELRSFVALVVTGFRELHDYAMLEEKGIGSRLGTAAYWAYLGVLPEKECRKLITDPLEGEVREEVVEAVYDASGGHPFITQYLMQQIWKPDPAQITLANVSKVRKKFRKEVRVFQSWLEKFEGFDRQVYHVLAQAEQPLALGEIQALIADKAEPGDIEDSLDFLSYTGVVAEQRDKYVAAGSLFRDWFLQRNPRGIRLHILDRLTHHRAGKSLPGISPSNYRRLRDNLLECGPFAGDRELRAIFVDARIRPWRDGLPTAGDRNSRVNAVIEYLYTQYSEAHENALVLLLRVLSDQIDAGDARHKDLADLADELEHVLIDPDTD